MEIDQASGKAQESTDVRQELNRLAVGEILVRWGQQRQCVLEDKALPVF